MKTILFMFGGLNIGLSEIMIIILAIFVVFLVLRNILIQPKK